MAQADECEDISICSREAPPETEIDDPSIGILPETDAGPVLAGPPVVTGPLTQCSFDQFRQYNFRPLTNFTDVAAAAATAAATAAASTGSDAHAAAAAAKSSVEALAQKASDDALAEVNVPTETQQREHEGFIESDEVSSNTTDEIPYIRDSNPLSDSFTLMQFIESQIKTGLLDKFNIFYDMLFEGLSRVVPDLPGANATKGFVGINRCGFLSKYTTVIYYAGRIPYNYRLAIIQLIQQCNDGIKPLIEGWHVGGNISFTCKVEKSLVQYDTQKIILCIKLATGNVIQLPILNVVGFPVFQDVTPLLGLVTPPSLPCFFTPQFNGVANAFIATYPAQFTTFIALNPQAQGVATAFMTANPTEFTTFIASNPQAQGVATAFIATYSAQFAQFASNPQIRAELQTLSLLDIIVRVRLCANQGAITALSEPSKEEVTLILSCFQGLMSQGVLPALMSGNMDASAAAAAEIVVPISAITQAIRTVLYTDANIKPFALFCNIFYNFINVSLGHRSLAKIIYSDFFSTSDNYGKVIRACQVVNNLPIMLHHVAFFLTGSNAARVYLALNKIIKLGVKITLQTIEHVLNETFGKLSDNDFMIYLKGPTSEPYRVFIRMILGGSFYFFKDLFDPGMLAEYNFTETMIQSVGIVGYMDHLFAQRFDAATAFLHRCYQNDRASFLAQIFLSMQTYFHELDKQINVAHFDGVFKHYTLKKFYDEIFHICGYIEEPPLYVYDFLINHATSINCIATVWTLVLNVLYTLFVPENCLARIVVGKFDNDPKNLKLYMEILNDHLLELRSLPGNGKEFIDTINKLQELQTTIAHMCEVGIKRDLLLFKQTCDQWVQSMVSAVAQSNGPSNYKGLFMLSESDAYNLGSRFPTKLERALCLAYLPTSRGNICSAASPTGPHIFREQILKIVDLDTNHIEGILSSDMFRRDAGEGVGQELLERLKKCGVNDGNLDAFLILPSDTMEKKPFKLEKELSEIFKKTCLEAPRKPLISLSGTDNLASILHSLTGNSTDTTTLLEKLKRFGVNDDNLNALGNVESSLIQEKFGMPPGQSLQKFIALCQQQLPKVGIVDESEITLYPNLTRMGSQMEVCLLANMDIQIEHEGTTSQLSTYLNLLWKHLTKTAIKLKILFKEKLTDTKRVTGIKFIALVLGGIFQIKLLVDEVFGPGTFETFTLDPTMAAIMAEWRQCKRGLLPLLIAPPILALIQYIFSLDVGHGINVDPDPIPKILKILGFLFSIKVKSSSPHSPYQLLLVADSMSCFKRDYDALYPQVFQQAVELSQQALQVLLDLNPEACKEAYDQSVQRAYKVAYTQAYAHFYPQAFQSFQASEGDVERATAAATASADTYAASAATEASNAPAAIAAAKLHAAAHVRTVETLSRGLQILNPTSGIFYDFLGKLGVNLKNRAIMKCICRAKPDVARIDTEMLQELWSSGLEGLYAAMGGGNDSYSNRGRKSVYSLNNNKHKYKYNKLVRNNCTHRNKNKRKKNSKSNSKSKSKSKSKSSSKSPSYANKKHKPNSRKTKSSKSRRKNVTFKRRKRSNRH